MMMPNMPMHPHFFNNLNIPQQFHQFGLPNHINQLLPNLLGNLLGGHSLPPLVHPTFFQPSLLDPFAFTSQPQGNSFNSLPYLPVPTPHQNHQMHPPGFSEPRPQVQSVGNVNNTNVTSNSKVNDFGNKYTKQQKFKGTGQGFQKSHLHQADNPKKKFGFNKDQIGKSINLELFQYPLKMPIVTTAKNGNKKKMATELDGSDADNIAKEKKRLEQPAIPLSPPFDPLTYLQNVKENASGYYHDKEAKMGRLDGKKGRFQNKRGSSGKDKFSKKPKIQDNNSSQESSITTEQPTLLEKLLSADIKRDKSQLLQVFHVMVMNSFFKESPEQPLKLPLVMVEETGCEHDKDDPTSEVLFDDESMTIVVMMWL
ncbi:hypothetical protein IGI04_004978 [Brassica rapa subsp. trilocularis]|uniref:FMR1-interacting protein 1 conserved domain-containing protein n=1 Tax=Brassica rapa subsp. trilocularis TaxID=1813537 RepID=A0ABQ7NG11_BRACM|nr:hypothetical protein IGI04_004978 [Brassica rapa subsp. trilocularis]